MNLCTSRAPWKRPHLNLAHQAPISAQTQECHLQAAATVRISNLLSKRWRPLPFVRPPKNCSNTSMHTPNPAFSSVTIFQMLDIRLILLAHQKTLFGVFGVYFERRVEIDAEKKNHTCRGGKNIYSATTTYLFSPHP